MWDQYKQDSLKADTREKRGKLKGIRRKVAASTKLPGNWQDFLKDNANKEELFSFLTSAVCCHTFPEGKTVVSTKGVATQSNQDFSMPHCFQEEADTRMLFHMKHMIENGLKTKSLKTVDSDVVVILVGLFYKIADQVDDIWVEYGAGKHLQYISIRTMYNQLGVLKAKAILFFHAFTGSDTTSAFRNKGKKTAWNTWKAFEEVTETFAKLLVEPFKTIEDDSKEVETLEKFVIYMYIKSSPLKKVNDARREIFCQKNQSMESLPPTKNALIQHIKRSVYQTGIWATAFETQASLPAASLFGWQKKANQWQPVWITIAEVALSCRDLVKCGCKTDCSTKRCSCKSADLPCTELCKCKCVQGNMEVNQ